MSQAQKNLEVAHKLHAEGYTGGVAARRLIEVHGMSEPAALAVVQQVYGKVVDPRGGETTTKILTSLLLIGLGLGLVAFVWMTDDDSLSWDFEGIAGGLAIAGGGLTRLIIAWVNAGVKEDLGPRD